MTKRIISKLTERLNRNLKQQELEAFKLTRTPSAYQLILDYVSNANKSVVELEVYVAFIINES